MNRLILLTSFLLLLSCNQKFENKLVAIDNSEAIKIDKSGIYEPGKLALVEITSKNGYKLIEAYYKCDVADGATLDSSKTKILECGEKIHRRNDTVKMYFMPGMKDIYFDSIVLLMQNPNGQFGICETVVENKW